MDGILKLFGQDLSEIGAEVIDASGQLIVSGFFDIHTHGGYHVDFNHASVDDLQTVSTFFASQETTYAHMSLVTDEISQIEVCIDAFKTYQALKENQVIRGIHLKGTFLSHDYRGSMPDHLLIDFDSQLLATLQEKAEGSIHYITVAR